MRSESSRQTVPLGKGLGTTESIYVKNILKGVVPPRQVWEELGWGRAAFGIATRS